MKFKAGEGVVQDVSIFCFVRGWNLCYVSELTTNGEQKLNDRKITILAVIQDNATLCTKLTAGQTVWKFIWLSFKMVNHCFYYFRGKCDIRHSQGTQESWGEGRTWISLWDVGHAWCWSSKTEEQGTIDFFIYRYYYSLIFVSLNS